MEEKTLAERIHEGQMAFDSLDARLDEMFGDLHNRHTTDWHDNSVEVFLTSAEDYQIPDPTIKEIFAMGFSRFWLRFPDNSEQAFTETSKGSRVMRPSLTIGGSYDL